MRVWIDVKDKSKLDAGHGVPRMMALKGNVVACGGSRRTPQAEWSSI